MRYAFASVAYESKRNLFRPLHSNLLGRMYVFACVVSVELFTKTRGAGIHHETKTTELQLHNATIAANEHRRRVEPHS